MVIRSVAVLGAGTMGAQIAAHFANAGVPALLLDVTAAEARQGLARARKLKPDPFFTTDTWTLVTTGGFDTDFARIGDCDWIVEAVVERIDVKQALLARVDQARRAGAVVSSNTSGLPLAAIAEGRSDDFKAHWLGTHFFNPPRYLHLLEIVPIAETRPEVVAAIAGFADRQLGKGVVIARDTPSFIANHVGLYGVLRMLDTVASGAYTIEEVDAITGPPLGRPKSATFRTLDIAGIDVLTHVVDNMRERLAPGADRSPWALPPFVRAMVERGLTGEKAGAGFYKRVPQPGGGSEIWTLDPATLDYRPRQAPRLPALDSTGSGADVRRRVRTLFEGTDRVGQFLRETLAPTLVYTARVAPDIAHAADDVDRAMRWGFGWELGPFELIDAIGVRQVVDAAAAGGTQASRGGPTGAGATPSPLLDAALQRPEGLVREAPLGPAAPDLLLLQTSRARHGVVRGNAGASLVDLGDGVLCVEFHSKMNVVGADTIEMLHAGIAEATSRFAALVVGNEGAHFSAGANLMLLLLEAQEGNWDEIDGMVRAFQQVNLKMKYAGVPVIAAPAGLALGGGCEICLHADRVEAAAETYMGLVEAGVGLIPAGGGTKEMVVRAADRMEPGSSDFLPSVQRAFEAVGFATVSSSAPDAERLGYLRPVDGVTMNRERVIAAAKARALQRVGEGYQPPAPRTAIRVGGEAVLAGLKLGVHLAWRAGRISDHDALIGRRLATIMAGGTLPHPSTVTEQELLDLEREAFLSLLGERKTLERIQHTLKTGKPLRN